MIDCGWVAHYSYFHEIESQLNSRPLTPICLADSGAEEPLTQSHLLLLEPQPNLPPGLFSGKDCYAKQKFKQIQYVADQFWKRWCIEYLTGLQERIKWIVEKENLKEGDLVLLCEETTPRGSWKTGKVIKTFPGEDGLVRHVELRTKHGRFKRPIHKLCLLMKAVSWTEVLGHKQIPSSRPKSPIFRELVL